MSAALADIQQPQSTHRDYSAQFKAEMIALVKANGGNVLRVATEQGIPEPSLRYWMGNEDRYRNLHEQKQLDLATKYEANLHRLVDSISDHDLSETPLNHKATAVGILTEKMLLLRGQPTSISLQISGDVSGFLAESIADVIDVTPESDR